jgi:hypothetical protein
LTTIVQQQQRGVPGDDRRDHTDRLVPGVDEVVGLVRRDHVALHLVGQPRVVVVPLGQVGHLVAHLPEQLAVVAGLQHGQPLGVAGDQLAEPVQQLAALGRGELAPRAAEGGARRGHGRVDVLGVGVGNLGPRLPGIGIGRGVGAPGSRGPRGTVDDHQQLVKLRLAGSGRHGISSA